MGSKGQPMPRRLVDRSVVPGARRRIGLLLATLGVVAPSSPAWSVSVGQMDDFQDGTTQLWTTPLADDFQPDPPQVAPDTGPAGVGDDALQVTSSGDDTGTITAGSKLVVMNWAQWTGDYLTAGVQMIAADVNNVGSTDLNLRLAFRGPGLIFRYWASSASIPLPAGSGWQTVVFPIAPSDLTAAFEDGGDDVYATLADVAELRLLSAANPNYRGDTIEAQLLVDNIIALPEPSRSVLLAAGLATLLILARWRPHTRSF